MQILAARQFGPWMVLDLSLKAQAKVRTAGASHVSDATPIESSLGHSVQAERRTAVEAPQVAGLTDFPRT